MLAGPLHSLSVVNESREAGLGCSDETGRRGCERERLGVVELVTA